ncbi:hypothetical protein HZA99_01690 [Candidatus Woesearchaeota archaeon]|nr:hypothetical protein [Candidatus Woesearchaeota archaeon]
MTAPFIITPKSLTLSPRINNCFATTPAITLDGYCMEFLFIPQGAEYPLFRKTVSISVLEGRLENPQLQKYETGYYPTKDGRTTFTSMQAAAESLLFLAYDTTEKNEEREHQKYALGYVLGPNLAWIDVESGKIPRRNPKKRYRTDPKIEIAGNREGRDVHWRMNLWHLIENLNGGIHTHAEDHPQFREFHVQLIGNGKMVKYRSQNSNSAYEHYPMRIGRGHPLFCSEEKLAITYPRHAYVTGDKGAVFAALEEVRT